LVQQARSVSFDATRTFCSIRKKRTAGGSGPLFGFRLTAAGDGDVSRGARKQREQTTDLPAAGKSFDFGAPYWNHWSPRRMSNSRFETHASSMPRCRRRAMAVRYWPLADMASTPHMSGIGGKADITIAACLLSRSLLGVKRTSLIAAHISASDPKRTYVIVGT
jgi:hypothetical protein